MSALSSYLLFAVMIGCLALEAWAVIDCATRPNDAFVAAGKLTKQAWLAILALAIAFTLFFGVLGLFGLAGVVASIVYLVDVKPAVREVQGGGNSGGW